MNADDTALASPIPNVETLFDRRLVGGVALIAGLVGAAYCLVGRHQFLGYDSAWHVFIARQDQWPNFWREVAVNAHPPLFYLALKLAVTLLGTSLLAYRAISIGASLISILLIALTIRRITRSTALAVLGASAFAFSYSVLNNSLEVRAYPLGNALLLGTFILYLDWIDPSARRFTLPRAIVYGVLLAIAMLTTYSAVFIIGACMSLPIALAAIDRRWRQNLVPRARILSGQFLLMFSPAILILLVIVTVHVSGVRLGHVPSFMFDGSKESAAAFVWRNTVNLAGLWTPGPPTPSIGRFLLGALLVLIILLPVARSQSRGTVAAVPASTLALLVLFNIVLGLRASYPYGGELRQEYFLFPFLVVSLFVGLDDMRQWWPAKRALLAVRLAALVAILANAWFWIPTFPYLPGFLLQAEKERFERSIPGPDAVYLDQFNLINFFTFHHDWTWTFVADRPLGGVAQVWRVSKGDRTFVVCRGDVWLVDLTRPNAYWALANCMHVTGIDNVALFRPQQPGFSAGWLTSSAPEAAARFGATYGLVPTTVVVDGEDVYAAFARRSAAGPRPHALAGSSSGPPG